MKKALALFFLLSLLLPAAAAAGDALDVDPVHSTVIFRVRHLGISWFQGRFNDLSGSIVFDESKPENSRVDLRLSAASVDTANKTRDEDLRSENFFNVEKYPDITFVSDKVARTEGGAYQVTGTLGMLGKTRTLTTEARFTGKGSDPWGGQRVGFVTSFAIRRSDFGMTYDLPTLVGNDVILSISVEGVLKKDKPQQ